MWVSSLTTRAPGRAGPTCAVPFTAIYRTHDEWAAEMANRTVHTVMHPGWVPDLGGGHRGQMAILVKPNGRFGTVYLAGINPSGTSGSTPPCSA